MLEEQDIRAFVYGTTAELIKIAPVYQRIVERGGRPLLWSTGQQAEELPTTTARFDSRLRKIGSFASLSMTSPLSGAPVQARLPSGILGVVRPRFSHQILSRPHQYTSA